MTDDSLDRRLTSLEAKVESIDMHGTRGMESVRAAVGGLQRDLGKLESTTDRIESLANGLQLTMATIRPPRLWPAVTAYAAAMLPMYALVIDLLVTRR